MPGRLGRQRYTHEVRDLADLFLRYRHAEMAFRLLSFFPASAI